MGFVMLNGNRLWILGLMGWGSFAYGLALAACIGYRDGSTQHFIVIFVGTFRDWDFRPLVGDSERKGGKVYGSFHPVCSQDFVDVRVEVCKSHRVLLVILPFEVGAHDAVYHVSM